MSDGLTKDAIEAIVGLADKARGVTLLDLPGGRHKLQVGADGKAEVIDVPPASRAEKLEGPTELARFIKDHMDDGSAVFVNESSVVAVYSLFDRRDAARCDLSGRAGDGDGEFAGGHQRRHR